MVLEMYSTGFGEMSVKLMPLILRIKHSQINNEKNAPKRKCLYYSLLVFLFMLTIIMKIVVKSAKGEMDESSSSYNPIADNEFLKLGLEMICLILISKLLLKYTYFIHHAIAIASFIFLE